MSEKILRKQAEQNVNSMLKKLDVRKGDTIMTVNCREMLEYTRILKLKILKDPIDAVYYVLLYENVIHAEMAKENEGIERKQKKN